ncbi:MAG: four helix bundle protein [Luteimonas sp.]
MHYQKSMVWQRAMDVAKSVYALVPLLPREELYGMRSQITRAAVSVAANVAEGWTRETARDKANYLAIAHGSLSEVEMLLTLCEHMGWFPSTSTGELRSDIDEVSRMLPPYGERAAKKRRNADSRWPKPLSFSLVSHSSSFTPALTGTPRSSPDSPASRQVHQPQ